MEAIIKGLSKEGAAVGVGGLGLTGTTQKFCHKGIEKNKTSGIERYASVLPF